MGKGRASLFLLAMGIISDRLCGGFTISTTTAVKSSRIQSSSSSSTELWSFNNNNNGGGEQALEAIQSLADFHEGTWQGTTRSFSVRQDAAAGIVQRQKSSSPYQVSVQLGLNPKGDRDISLMETFSWSSSDNNDGDDDNDSEKNTSFVKSRSLSMSKSQVDVDSVDASYSLDTTLPDLPSALTGSLNQAFFLMEHVIAASEDRRVRCWVLYDLEKQLDRIVVCDEHRLPEDKKGNTDQRSNNQLTARDLLEMENDVDRLVSKLTGETTSNKDNNQNNNNNNNAEDILERLSQSMSKNADQQQQQQEQQQFSSKLVPHTMSLLEMSSGVWLGDAIIRDMPTVQESMAARGEGFARSSSSSLSSKPQHKNNKSFGDWDVGVQKVAWRTMWNFGDEIRHVVDVGKAMGSCLATSLSKSMGGSVCVNEGLKRRMPKEDRMVYIDWESTDMVGFLVGPVSIQVPRYLPFGNGSNNISDGSDDNNGNKASSGSSTNRSNKPFFTEFGLFQAEEQQQQQQQQRNNNNDNVAVLDPEGEGLVTSLPQLICSKISRVYNYEGELKQGCTSFYSFDRFGPDAE